MSNSLTKVVKYLSERIHCDKCTGCKSYLDYMSVKDDQSLDVLRAEKLLINKELSKRFRNTYEFCYGDINKFVLLLRNGVYSFECMDKKDLLKNICLIKKFFVVN